LEQRMMLWSVFQQPHISANRGLAVEKSLPPKTSTLIVLIGLRIPS
jgi:hypothetical protein